MRSIVDAFERTVFRFPDKPAMIYKDTVYTFSDLQKQSRKLATTILEKNPEKKGVACIVNRDADVAIFFLAALYSGTYYIPIDPDMPVKKIQAVLESCQPDVLLCGEGNKELLATVGFDKTVLTLKDQAEEMAQVPDLYPEDPIYMVYTSGSTGTPKGVIKSHGAVISFIEAFTLEFELGADEKIGNQTPFFFDASAKDFYLMVYKGATLEVLASDLFIFPLRLIEHMNASGITYICWVPTALSIVIQMGAFKVVLPTTLKKVFFVGEVFPIKQLRAWLQTLPDIRYVNLYGSTELSGIACYYELDSSKEYTALPMGKALPNCQVFLWDKEKDCIVTEAGQVGEVCIASDALADEYYGDPEKTAEVFTTMMTPSGEEERVLKSGDMAQYDEDGNLNFVTRKDFQIKHMGRRIELGEIEATADAIDEIQRCACLYNQEKKKICLFCELKEGSEWTKKDVTHALRERLTAYMMPSKVVVMDKLYYNANGKIDRPRLKELM